jgi:hypothetical protein
MKFVGGVDERHRLGGSSIRGWQLLLLAFSTFALAVARRCGVSLLGSGNEEDRAGPTG